LVGGVGAAPGGVGGVGGGKIGVGGLMSSVLQT